MKRFLTLLAVLSFSAAATAQTIDLNDPNAQQEALKKAQEMLNNPETKAQLEKALQDPEVQKRVQQVLQDPEVQKLLQQQGK